MFIRFLFFLIAFALLIIAIFLAFKYLVGQNVRYEKAVVEKWHDDKEKKTDKKIKKLHNKKK